jgi:hypothetical protein
MGIDCSENASVIAYLANIRKRQLRQEATRLYDPPPFGRPDECAISTTHPDIISRVWQLGAKMPSDCRAVVYGCPALVHPRTNVIFVFGGGTAYDLRLPQALADQAVSAGAFTHHKWASGGEINIRAELGEEWVGGRWLEREPQWCLAAYNHFGALPP